MKTRMVMLLSMGLVLSACHFFSPPAKNSPINCEQLKRQQVYNQTNLNTEATRMAERQTLTDMIAKNCK